MAMAESEPSSTRTWVEAMPARSSARKSKSPKGSSLTHDTRRTSLSSFLRSWDTYPAAPARMQCTSLGPDHVLSASKSRGASPRRMRSMLIGPRTPILNATDFPSHHLVSARLEDEGPRTGILGDIAALAVGVQITLFDGAIVRKELDSRHHVQCKKVFILYRRADNIIHHGTDVFLAIRDDRHAGGLDVRGKLGDLVKPFLSVIFGVEQDG